jgi:hypothetical protein
LRLGSIDGINEYEHYLPLNVWANEYCYLISSKQDLNIIKTKTIKLIFDAFPHSIHRRTKTCRFIFSIVYKWLVYSWIVISVSVNYKKGAFDKKKNKST